MGLIPIILDIPDDFEIDDGPYCDSEVSVVMEALASRGLTCTREQAIWLWWKRSECWSAGWLSASCGFPWDEMDPYVITSDDIEICIGDTIMVPRNYGKSQLRKILMANIRNGRFAMQESINRDILGPEPDGFISRKVIMRVLG